MVFPSATERRASSRLDVGFRADATGVMKRNLMLFSLVHLKRRSWFCRSTGKTADRILLSLGRNLMNGETGTAEPLDAVALCVVLCVVLCA